MNRHESMSNRRCKMLVKTAAAWHWRPVAVSQYIIRKKKQNKLKGEPIPGKSRECRMMGLVRRLIEIPYANFGFTTSLCMTL